LRIAASGRGLLLAMSAKLQLTGGPQHPQDFGKDAPFIGAEVMTPL
jgi:hypothetical protein